MEITVVLGGSNGGQSLLSVTCESWNSVLTVCVQKDRSCDFAFLSTVRTCSASLNPLDSLQRLSSLFTYFGDFAIAQDC